MRFGIQSVLWLAFAINGICQDNPPFQFEPYTGPTIVYPDTEVNFSVLASDGDVSSYDFLAAPTNAQIQTRFEGGRPPDNGGFISWLTPSRASVGTTNIFVVRAVNGNDETLMATCTVSFVVIDVPPISSITLSNNFPVLVFTNAIPQLTNGAINSGQSYMIQCVDMLPTTNWSLLAQVSSTSPTISVTDTNPPAAQRFYKLIPDGGWYYDPFVFGP